MKTDNDLPKVHEQWKCFEQWVVDGKPIGLDHNPARTEIRQRWRPDKYRMDYMTNENTTTSNGYQLKGFDELVEHIKDSLRLGYIVEIHPDYKRPKDKNY